MAERKRNYKEVILSVLLTVLFAGLLIWLNSRVGPNLARHNNDYMLVHIAGNALRAGLDVYDPAQWERAHTLFGNAFYSDNPIFLYPLPFAFFFIPFSYFSIPVGEIVWLFVGEILFIFSMGWLIRGIDLSKFSRLTIIAVSIVLFLPVIVTIWARQHSFLLFFFLVSSYVLISQRKDLAGGVMLSSLALRPNPVLFLVPAILIWAGLRARWKLWLSTVTSGSIYLLISWWIRPGWPSVWIDYAIGAQGKIHDYVAFVPTLWGMLTDFDAMPQLAKVAVGVITTVLMVGISVWWLRREKQKSFSALLLLFVPASLFLSPYAWNYDQLFLLLPLMLILLISETSRRPVRRLLRIWIVVLMLVLPYALRIVALLRGNDTLSALLPLSVWFLGLYATQRSRSGPLQQADN